MAESFLDGPDFELKPVVVETLLSRKPAPGSLAVSLASLAALFLGSVVYWNDLFGLGPYLPASREAVFGRGELFRVFTSLAAHEDVQHFLSNALPFGVLAFLLFGYYGVLAHPFLSCALGAFATALALLTYPPDTLLLGASGVVYEMAGFWLTLYLGVERRARFGRRLLRAIGFALVVLVPTAIEPQVSYRTHAIGFGLGVVSGLLYFAWRKERLRAFERIEGDFP